MFHSPCCGDSEKAWPSAPPCQDSRAIDDRSSSPVEPAPWTGPVCGNWNMEPRNGAGRGATAPRRRERSGTLQGSWDLALRLRSRPGPGRTRPRRGAGPGAGVRVPGESALGRSPPTPPRKQTMPGNHQEAATAHRRSAHSGGAGQCRARSGQRQNPISDGTGLPHRPTPGLSPQAAAKGIQGPLPGNRVCP